MANGVIPLTSNHSRMAGQIVWESSSNGSVANNSTVTAHLQVKKTDTYSSWGTWTGSENVGGTSESFSTYATVTTSWVTLKTITTTVPHNDNGTGSCYIYGLINGPSGTTLEGYKCEDDAVVALDTIPRYATANQSLASRTLNTVTMNWSSDSTIDYIWYSKDGGSSWIDVGSVNGTSGSYIISGLSPNTSYSIKTKVRRKDSQLTTESSVSTVTTYQIATISSAPNFNDEENPTIQYNNPFGNGVTSLQACISFTGANDDIEYRDIPKTGTSYTFNLTDEERNILRNATTTSNSRKLIFFIKTEYNGTYYSTVEKILTIINANPIFDNFTFVDNNEKTIALTGDNQKLIKYYSGVTATISVGNKAIAQKSATMDKYRLTVGTKQKDESYSNTEDVSISVSNIESNDIIVYAIDSRGNSTLKQLAPSDFKEYIKIGIKNAVATRGEGGVGTNVTLNYEGIIWNNNFGTKDNSIKSIKYYYKISGAIDWIEGKTNLNPILSGNTFSQSVEIQGDLEGEGFNQENSYDIKIIVEDELSSSEFSFILGPGIPLVAYHKNGIAFGNKYDTSINALMQIYGDVYNKGNLLIFKYFSGLDDSVLDDIPKLLGKNYLSGKPYFIELNPPTTNSLFGGPTFMIEGIQFDGGYGSQIAYSYDKTNLIKKRSQWNGVWTPWVTIENQTLLYYNLQGSNGTITLSDSADNYDKIEIYFRNNNAFQNCATSIKSAYSRMCALEAAIPYHPGNQMWFQAKIVNISGTSITTQQDNTRYGEIEIYSNQYYANNNIYILKVIGYK